MGYSSGDLRVSRFGSQKRIIRCIFNLHPSTSCKSYFKRLDVLTAPSLYFLALVTFVKKNPDLFSTNFEQYGPEMDIVTRNRGGLRVPPHSSTFYEKGPHYQAIKAYEMLPDNIAETESFTNFRSKTLNFLKEKRYYSFKFNS